jgi:hypothetical protein
VFKRFILGVYADISVKDVELNCKLTSLTVSQLRRQLISTVY